MTTKPSNTAIQSSVRHLRAATAGALASPKDAALGAVPTGFAWRPRFRSSRRVGKRAPHHRRRGKVPNTISRITTPAATAAQPSTDAGEGASIGDCGFGIETGFLSTRRLGVEFSISSSEFAIIFFSLRGFLDYYMENNASQRFCGDGAMRFLPVFFDTSAGVFILVGSGEPALGKLRLLRAAGAHVRWFSCDADVAEEVLTLPGEGRLEISVGDPLEADLSDVVAIVSAAGPALDTQIAERARRQRLPVNIVDRPELSTFIFPAIVDRGGVVGAISTGGSAPALARRLRELIEAALPTRIGDLAELIGRHRRRFTAVPRALSPRRL